VTDTRYLAKQTALPHSQE